MKYWVITFLALALARPSFAQHKISSLQAAETIDHPALSLLGPFGPIGPFSELGPIGNAVGTPHYWWEKIVQMGVWSSAPKGLFDWFGPTSDFGPLGKGGPLSETAIQTWILQYGERSVYSVFGPLGPMGALGPLGPLGPLGAVESTGLKRHEDGYYIRQAGKTASTVLVEGREFPIFENLKISRVEKLSESYQLDTSFMVRNQLGSKRSHKYGITSSAEQTVFIIAVPLLAMQNVVLKAVNSSGEVIAKSDKFTMANHLKLQVPQGERFQVVVESLYGFEAYRLIVVGAGQLLQ